MIFVLVITLWSLSSLAVKNFASSRGFDIAMINAIAAVSFIALAIYLAIVALFKVRSERRTATGLPAVSSITE